MSEQEKDNSQQPAGTSPDSAAQPEKPAAEKPAPAKPPAPPVAPPRQAPPKNPVEDELRARFGDKIELKYGINDLEIHVKPDDLLDVCGFLKSRTKGPFTFLRNLTAVDWKDQGCIETIYHLCPFPDMATVCIKCRLPRQAPAVPTVTGIWDGANWLEREVFDLFGVDFIDHPDQRRIMLPPEWEGHPLRKDYVHKEPALPCKPKGAR